MNLNCISLLNLAKRECREVQGKRGSSGRRPELVTCSFCLWNHTVLLPFLFFKVKCDSRLVCAPSSRLFLLLCVCWKTMETLSYEWGGRPELGISARPGTKEVFAKYLIELLYCQRNLCKYVFVKNKKI